MQVDIITITKANCAARMTYYESLLVTLMTFKAVVLVTLLLSVVAPRVKYYWKR